MPGKQKKKKSYKKKSGKLYCGSSSKLPNSDYKRRGTPKECLSIGIGVGRRIEFEDLRKRIYSKHNIRIRRRPQKKG